MSQRPKVHPDYQQLLPSLEELVTVASALSQRIADGSVTTPSVPDSMDSKDSQVQELVEEAVKQLFQEQPPNEEPGPSGLAMSCRRQDPVDVQNARAQEQPPNEQPGPSGLVNSCRRQGSVDIQNASAQKQPPNEEPGPSGLVMSHRRQDPVDIQNASGQEHPTNEEFGRSGLMIAVDRNPLSLLVCDPNLPLFSLTVSVPNFKPSELTLYSKNRDLILAGKRELPQGSEETFLQHEFVIKYQLPTRADSTRISSYMTHKGTVVVMAPAAPGTSAAESDGIFEVTPRQESDGGRGMEN